MPRWLPLGLTLLLALSGSSALAQLSAGPGDPNAKKTTEAPKPQVILTPEQVKAKVQEASKRPKIREESRIWILRSLHSEFATTRKAMPRGPDGLPLDEEIGVDEEVLLQRITNHGPAVRPGEIVQITGVQFKDDMLVLEINGGGKQKRKWYEGISIGMGRSTHPVSTNQSTESPTGSTIELAFYSHVPDMTPDDVRKLLNPVLDFSRRSATTVWIESLPAEFQEAIKEHKAVAGMDRDSVLAAMGRPDRKLREKKKGVEYEDWIYGTAPSKVTIVTFDGDKVLEVKELTPGVASAEVRQQQDAGAAAGTLPTPPAPPPVIAPPPGTAPGPASPRP